MASRGVLVLDWDWSTVNEDTDTWVPGRLDPGLSKYIKAQSAAGTQWTALMADVARRLHAKGRTPADIDRVLCEIPVFKEVLQAIQLAHDHGIDVHVVSDANDVYIRAIARHHGIDSFLTSIVTNRAAFAPSGLLVIEPHQPPRSPHGCTLCPVNLCKGLAMDRLGLSWPCGAAATAAADEHAGEAQSPLVTVRAGPAERQRRKSRSRSPGPAAGGAGGTRSGLYGALVSSAAHACSGAATAPPASGPALRPRVLYLGDGRGDLCACLRMGPGDVICARDGYPLLAALRAQPRGTVRAVITPWRDGRGVLSAVEAFVRSLQPSVGPGAWIRDTLGADAASALRGLAGGRKAAARAGAE